MDTKLLYIISLTIASCVGGFYYYSGKSQKLEVTADRDLSSNADKIQITQTDDQGKLYAKTNILSMTQWMTSGKAELNQVQGILYQNGLPNATFNADKAFASDEYRQVELNGNISVTKLDLDQKPTITVQTEKLLGDTKTNQIQTDRVVFVTNPQAQFSSQGLNANLTTGQYDFFNIRGKYDPISQ